MPVRSFPCCCHCIVIKVDNSRDFNKDDSKEIEAESTPETYESEEALKAIDNIVDRTPSKEASLLTI